MEVSETDIKEVIQTYFAEHSFAKQQLDSCDKFFDEDMQRTIDDMKDIVITKDNKTIYKICFGQMSLDKPKVTEPDGDTRLLYPRDARLRNLSYSGALSCAITITESSSDGVILNKKTYDNVYIGKVPIMIKSKFCNLLGTKEEHLCRLGEDPDDIGGYFIVNGIERVLIAQERMRNNHVFVSKTNPEKNEYIAEMRSKAACQSKPPSIISVHMKSARGDPSRMCIRATLPYIRKEIPVAIIFHGLGFHSEKEIMECIGIDDVDMAKLIRPSLDEAREMRGEQEALNYIGNRGIKGVQTRADRIKFAKDTLENMLPHSNFIKIETRVSVACNFGYIIYRLLQCALGRRREDDKNHYVNKRIDLSGTLLNDLFRKLFRRLKRDTRTCAEKCVEKGKEFNPQFMSADIITQGFRHAIASGNWDDKTVGVSQVLHRLTYVATFSHLRRLSSTFGYQPMTQTSHRQLHNSQWGRICPAETPEGQACGLLKNLALTAHITVGSFDNQISKLLEVDEETTEFQFLSRSTEVAYDASTKYKILLNGCFLGFHSNVKQFVNKLRQSRRKAAITSEVGVVMDFSNREVRICTDYGRCTRPLLVVENLNILMKKKDVQELEKDGLYGKWDKLIRKGYLEYIDADEEETTMISMTIKDPSAHVLYYPQKPLVKTWMSQQLDYRQPAGNNAIVAISSCCFNQEDSIIMNKSSIDRGLFRSSLLRSYRDEVRRMRTLCKEDFGCPDRADTLGMRSCSYANIDSDGLVQPGTVVRENDILIGKTARIYQENTFQANYKREDRSTYLRPYQRGRVDQLSGQAANLSLKGSPYWMAPELIHPYMQNESDPDLALAVDIWSLGCTIIEMVMITTNGDGLPLAKVRVRSARTPEIGDKFSSRHGQKSVVGMIYTQEDLPWTVEGITPDIIINPHSFPSRMTIGQFMESILGKVAAREGKKLADATPFTDVTDEIIKKALHKCGYQKCGMEAMHSGETGRLLSQATCIGPTFYMKLAHMVEDKIQSRARGSVQTLTRQPTQGRSLGGGIRFGEMERDCLISHGSALLLRERLMELSDPHDVYVCQRCGYIAQTKSYCKICRISAIAPVHVPYAWKLLCQELMAMSIAPRMI